METVFLKLFNMSITAGWIVLAVMVLRLLTGKAPKWTRGLLWGLPALRLCFPFSIQSIFSLIPSRETLSSAALLSDTPAIESGIPLVNEVVNPVMTESFAPTVGASVNPLQIAVFAASVVWLVGFFGMLLYTAVSFLAVRARVRERICLKDNVYLCDRICSPFILGVIKPKIFLPSDIGQADVEVVLLHERAHIRRGDHILKPIAFLLLSVYWFHPLVWLAYIFFCKDLELAADERVIKTEGETLKKQYSETLVRLSAPRRSVAPCPLAFGENNVKARIKNVLHYKKPTLWVLIAVLIISVVGGVCFLTDPAEKTPIVEPDGQQALSVYSLSDFGVLAVGDSTVEELPKGAVSTPVEKGEAFRYPLDESGNDYVLVVFEKTGMPIQSIEIYDYPYDKPSKYMQKGLVYSILDGEATLEKYYGKEKNLVIPDTLGGYPVTRLGDYIFYSTGCYPETVVLPGNIKSIAAGTFFHCPFTTLHIPTSVTEIEGTFTHMANLERITVDADNPSYCDIDGVLFSKDKTKLICYPEGRKSEVYAIPETVTELDGDAFWKSPRYLKELSFPDSIKQMPEGELWHLPMEATFIVSKGSAAETYAKEYGVKYKYDGKR